MIYCLMSAENLVRFSFSQTLSDRIRTDESALVGFMIMWSSIIASTFEILRASHAINKGSFTYNVITKGDAGEDTEWLR